MFKLNRVKNWGQFINEKKEYLEYLRAVSFSELPFEYKKSLMLYMIEGDSVDWSINNTIDEISKDDGLVNIIIDDYMKVGRNKHKTFAYGMIPTELLTDEVCKRMGYDTFQEYHEWYNDTTNHGNSVLPIIIDSENDELIEDGWHRFHSYYRKGLKEIPVLALMD